jgi:hypothetical protein
MNRARRVFVDRTHMRIGAWLRHVVFDASRQRRASEIVAWANAIAALGIGALVFALFRSWPLAAVVPVVAFVMLRAALMYRHTVWIAASFGTLAVAGVGGGLAWLFGHVFEIEAAPPIAALLGAALSAIAPSWAYARLAQRRLEGVRDSLLSPAPSSGNP